jgi:hypothetical protein
MTQLEINGVNFPVDSAHTTWGQLLEELETKRISKGNGIASIYFDGSEIAQFRHGDMLAKPLDAVGEIKIESASMNDMVKAAVIDVDSFLLSLQTAMVDAAETFRNQMLDQANQKLIEIFHGIKMLVSLLKGLEISVLAQNGSNSANVDRLLEEMGPTLESLIEAQGQQDWILVADILEFELSASMSSFEPVLVALKQKLM